MRLVTFNLDGKTDRRKYMRDYMTRYRANNPEYIKRLHRESHKRVKARRENI